MNYKDHKAKLEELYKIAVEKKDVGSALNVLDRIDLACVAEAEANKSKVEK